MSTVEDLKYVRQDIRAAVRDADAKLARKTRENPELRRVLDFRLLAVALAGAFVIAFALRLSGWSALMSIVLFVVLAGGGWYALIKLSTPRDPTRPTVGGAEPQP